MAVTPSMRLSSDTLAVSPDIAADGDPAPAIVRTDASLRNVTRSLIATCFIVPSSL